MSTTQGAGAPAAGSAPASSTPAPGAAPAPAATPAPAGASSAAPAAGAAPEGDKGKEKPLRGVQAAAQRAQARLAQQNKSTEPAPGGEQAPGTAGASTQPAKAGEAKPGEGGTPTAGADDPSKGTGSTVQAPQDWPQQHRELFEKLPDDGRKLVLDMQKDMQRGLTAKTTQLAELEKKHGDTLALAEKFDQGRDGAREVIAELARRAGMEIFFDRPLPEGEVPEFKTTAEMVQYATNKALELLRKEQKEKDDSSSAAARKNALKDSVRQQFAQAAKDFSDFDSFRAPVVDVMAATPGLSVAQAYQLVTYDALKKQASDGAAAQRELAALKTQIENEKKKHTAPPPGGNSAGAQGADEKQLSPVQRAHLRAQRKIAERSHRAQ